MKNLLFLILSFLMVVPVLSQVDTTQHVTAERRNSSAQQSKPYVILISVDGFRYDYAKKYNANNLLQLSSNGVSAESMIPSYPSLTFPNHYTIVTGLYPSHHGIVENNFYDAEREETYTMKDKNKVEDGTWYGGTPIWVLAEQQKMLSASFYWVASEAPIKGILPTYYYKYNEKIAIDKRIQVVVDWLNLPAETRPHLITFYFPEVDHNGHDFGPDADETRRSVEVLDSSIGKLVEAVKTTGLPVNFILVSDHGMTNVDTTNTLNLPAEVDTSKFKIPAEGVLVTMYAKNKKDIESTYNILKKNEANYKTYLKTNFPRYLHYGKPDDRFNRIGDILVIPKHPNVFNIYNKHVSKGWHGYNPFTVKDMGASFYAWGPAFASGLKIPSFSNIHIYPLVAEILGLKITEKIDGKLKVLEKTLKEKN